MPTREPNHVKLHSRQTTPARRFAFALVGIALIIFFGTAGYIAIEGMTFVDAFYMSVITVSTVGFEEVTPLARIIHKYRDLSFRTEWWGDFASGGWRAGVKRINLREQ